VEEALRAPVLEVFDKSSSEGRKSLSVRGDRNKGGGEVSGGGGSRG
jgi:hypothetical protein